MSGAKDGALLAQGRVMELHTAERSGGMAEAGLRNKVPLQNAGAYKTGQVYFFLSRASHK